MAANTRTLQATDLHAATGTAILKDIAALPGALRTESFRELGPDAELSVPAAQALETAASTIDAALVRNWEALSR